jgi:prepilin-type N-terminal cleavage/methylation domain-containing protein
MKNKKSQSGYTLIELLTVMVVLVAVGMIITSILVSTLRSGDKSTTTNYIRQSGNYAIAQMSKMIAYAKSFNGVYDETNKIWTDCVNSPANQKYHQVRITSFDGGQTIFKCDTGAQVLSSNSANLINPLDTSAVCSFTCSQNDASTSPTINVDLVLQKLTSTGITLLPESQTKIDFQTSITLRNDLIDITNP